MEILFNIAIGVLAAAIGVAVTIIVHRSMAKTRAKQIIADAEREAEDLKRTKELQGREEALKITSDAEKSPTSACRRFRAMRLA